MNQIIDIIMWIIYFLLLFINIFWILIYLSEQKVHKPMNLKSFPIVTIAIPVHNEEKVIEQCLQSAINLDYPMNKIEIILVDNASTDNTVKLAKKFIKKSHKIRVISIKEKGKGLALNKALEQAKGEFFVVLDADSAADKDILKKLLPHFCEDNNIACVLPMMKIGKTKTFLQKIQWYEYTVNIFYKSLMGKINTIHVAPGPFSVYRTEILREIGGFSHPNLTEDLEVTFKLQKSNYQIVQVMNTIVRTEPPTTVKKLYRQRLRWYKGSVFNTLNPMYRKLWFNRKYGDFGLIQMPLIIIPGFFAVFLFVSYIYYILKTILKFILNLTAVNFDIITLISFNLDFNIFDINFARMVIALLMLVSGIFVIVLAHRETQESLLEKGILPLLSFLFLLPFFLAFVWCAIIVEIIVNKTSDW